MTICKGVRERARWHVENFIGGRDEAIKSASERFHPYDPTTLRRHLRNYDDTGPQTLPERFKDSMIGIISPVYKPFMPRPGNNSLDYIVRSQKKSLSH